MNRYIIYGYFLYFLMPNLTKYEYYKMYGNMSIKSDCIDSLCAPHLNKEK